MGKLFSNLTDTANLEKTTDRVGGGFEPFPSDVYTGKIKLAYVGKSSSSEARNITLIVDVAGKELRETIYITTGKGENFYVDKSDQKKRPLPGFELIDDICLLTTNAGLVDQDSEEKVVKIYDYTQRADVNTPVQCLTALHGQDVKLCVLREIVDKEKKNDAGEYVATGETRSQNKIYKAVHPETDKTVNEYRNEIDTATFLPAWLEMNKGKDRDLVKKGAAGTAAGITGTGRPGGVNMFGGASAAGTGAKKTLFGGK